jgi:hypothetical protein
MAFLYLPFFENDDIPCQEFSFDWSTVKRRRKLEKLLDGPFGILDENDEAFLVNEYGGMISILSKEIDLLGKYIHMLNSGGRFKHTDLIDAYEKKLGRKKNSDQTQQKDSSANQTHENTA